MGFELTVRKRKAYPVAVEGWKVVSGAEVEPGESVTIVVDHLKMCSVGCIESYLKAQAFPGS
jgi:hypothetical protein